MKAVILSCNTGGGHNSAGRAIAEQLEARGISAEIVNALDFMSRVQSRVISQGHVFAYKKLPKLYGVGYRFEESHTPKGMYYQCEPAAQKLYPFLCEAGYDVVICVHIFAALMMTYIRRTYGRRFPTCFVATDYTCSPGVELTEVDAYCIPKGLSQEFVENGLPEERLRETGIPVGTAFCAPKDAEAAKAALGLEPDRRQVVVSCGSMGCGPMRSLAVLLAERLPKDTGLTILCGNNKSLKRDLQVLARRGRVRVLGYTDQMTLWLRAADVLLSKPGGLTSTEAMTMGVPFICINAVPGCETRNLNYFIAQGYAKTAKHVLGLTELTLELLEHPEQCDAMTQRQRAAFSGSAAAEIAALAEALGRQGVQERLTQQFDFLREIDKEKEIVRQTWLASGNRKEGDAEHAWHLAIMTLLLSEHANEKIDVLKTVAMVLIHDLVEIDAGDTYAYDEVGKQTQRAREEKAAERIFGMLPPDQREKMRALWEEFEARATPEAKFARTMDNVQPMMLNDATGGRAWEEHGVHLHQIMGRNQYTAEGSREIWDFAYQNFLEPHIDREIKPD